MNPNLILNSNLIPMNANFIPVNPNIMMEPIMEAAVPEAQEDLPARVPPGLEQLVFNEDTKYTVNLIEMGMMIFIAFIAWLCLKA